jgi:Subtilase family
MVNVLFRRPGRFLAVHWAITLALATALLTQNLGSGAWNTGTSRTVTLLTGERVSLNAGGTPAPASGLTTVRVAATDTYEIPFAVAPYVGTFWDPRLFDVTYLESHGLGDDQTAQVPLLITFANHAEAVRAYRRGTLDGAIHITHVFEYVPMASGYVDKSGPYAPESLPSNVPSGTIVAPITQALESTPTNSTAVDGDGVTALFLDDVVQATPESAQPLLDGALPIIGADAAHAAGLTGKGVRIAVVDTGIDNTHPDLLGRVIAAQNFSTDRDTVDYFGHGTHVASIAAGTGAASNGAYMGVAPDALLINAKALSSAGGGTNSGIIKAMEWAADQGANVINMSLGGAQSDGTDPLSRAVNAISEKKNVLFVIAAGNSGQSQKVSTPAAADLSLAVGAIDKGLQLAAFSSRGPRFRDMALKPDIVAPGVQITAARANYGSGNPYVTMSGTSMATPMTAGSAALIWQLHPKWSAAQVKDALMSAATPIGQSCSVSAFDQGAGTVNLRGMLEQTVVLSPGSVSFGKISGGAADRGITITNITDKPVTVSLRATLCATSGAGAIQVSPASVTVPAAGSAKATVKLSGLSVKGTFFGELRAAQDDKSIAGEPIGFVIQ